ncbi:hypothetical protein NUW58_g474 [Xylaria curta]|uniref:Uncharacterized protein n=1 Tax=Xylaria curta TaxID=42375 RepID=A0ACC1PP46_9PEZI|nr:hypothetical protein NUW58_g474 [Xylaria curta]
MNDHEGLALALEEARKGYEEGGIPIGAALVAADGRVLGRGHNMRVQNDNPILHVSRLIPFLLLMHIHRPRRNFMPAERRTFAVFCIPGEHHVHHPIAVRHVEAKWKRATKKRFPKAPALASCGEAYLKQRGVEVVVLDSSECQELMERFIAEKPTIWNEDIGVEKRVYTKENPRSI